MMGFEGSMSRGGGEKKGDRDHRNWCDGGGGGHGLPAGGGANRTYKGKDVEEEGRPLTNKEEAL